MNQDKPHSILDNEALREISAAADLAPRRHAACSEALNLVQRRHGWVSNEAVEEIARLLAMTPAEVDSVATFYSLIFRKPVGKNVILLCDSVSCFTLGCTQIRDYLCERFSIRPGLTTPDGRFTLLPVACLGACDRGPAIMINNRLHTRLSLPAVEAILTAIEQEHP